MHRMQKMQQTAGIQPLAGHFCRLSLSLSLVVFLGASFSVNSVTSASVATAETGADSPAARAARAAEQSARLAQRIALCHHSLLYGRAEARAHLQAVLAGRTCAEALAATLPVSEEAVEGSTSTEGR